MDVWWKWMVYDGRWLATMQSRNGAYQSKAPRANTINRVKV